MRKSRRSDFAFGTVLRGARYSLISRQTRIAARATANAFYTNTVPSYPNAGPREFVGIRISLVPKPKSKGENV